ncbi:MAG: hypothetical protein IIZ53_03115 [Ruminococcus sp.]|nr:hypothetical protein [Ruminococcus sp.]
MTKLVLVKKDMSIYEAEDILSFSFVKDAYLPYTKLSAAFLSDLGDTDDIAEAKLIINGKLIHHGCIDTFEIKKSGSIRKAYLTSSGFTSQLCRNQIEPGLKMGISLNSLMDNYCTLPYVEHENNADASNYIYIKQNTAMWDAVAALSYKLCGTYPYIRDANTVRITAFQQPETFLFDEGACLVSGVGADRKRLGSNYHMADINGEYGHYDLEDSTALGYKIVRHTYSELDMRFLYSPQQALEYRDKLDCRAMKNRYIVYSGYKGEDLWDCMKIDSENTARIMFIEIKGSSKGIITKTGTYTDKFPKEP